MKLAEAGFDFSPQNIKRLTVPTILLVVIGVAGFMAPGTLRFTAITAAVQGLIALSSGMLFGRVGLLALCPLGFAGLSTWVMAWLTVNHRMPFFVMLAIATLAAVPAGLIVGGLALRLRGVNLAIVTLAFGAAIVSIFAQHKFPGSQDAVKRSTRPFGFTSDRMYFVLCFLILIAVGVALEWFGRRRAGQSWRAVRYSERATASAGLSVSQVKLKAFVVSALMSGVAGALFVGQYKGGVSETSFLPLGSLAIVAASVMVGSQSLSGAVMAGLLSSLVPELFRRNHWATQYPQMLFGLGAIQALSKGGGGISSTFPWRMPRRSTAPPPAAPPALAEMPPDTSGGSSTSTVLQIRGLGVRYGVLAALSDVDLEVPSRTVVGVIGPNGAGKSTLIDALTGFIAGYAGSITLDGEPIDQLSATGRAQVGLRRTFQQGRAIPELTVGQFITLATPKPLAAAELDELLGFFGLPPADEPISFIDVGTRRILEVAACIASRPKVAFLDEPAAGLGHEQSVVLGQRIKEIPARFGCSVVLVEHDVALVAQASSTITVLDFGGVLASGTPAEVLANPAVSAAYLGDEVFVSTDVATIDNANTGGVV
jgi:branched-chain amino acid transport system permease protein